MRRRTRSLVDIEAAINRWETRLLRAATALRKLRSQRKRITDPAFMARNDEFLKRHPRPPGLTTKVMGVAIPLDNEPPLTELPPEPADDLAIPAFMRRTPVNAVDEAAKAAILAERDAKTKAKKKASAEKSKAARRGDLKRMPLSGKAAMEAILGEAIYGK